MVTLHPRPHTALHSSFINRSIHEMMRYIFYFLLTLLLLGACQNPSLERGGEVLLEGESYPSVIWNDGNFYLMTQSGHYDSLMIRRSQSVAGLGEAEPVFIWDARSKGMSNIYSPELHRINDKWYLYFEADDGVNTDNHQLYVLENPGADPLDGNWILHGPIITNPDWNFGLHPSVFEAKGRHYLLWSGWPTRRTETETQCIYIAEMENPWSLKSERVLISRPEYEWERQWVNRDGSRTAYPIYVNENPNAVISPDGKRVIVAYSASGIWSDYTTVGLLHASIDSDLLDSASWQKEPEPFFRADSESGLFGISNVAMVRNPAGEGYHVLYLVKQRDPEREEVVKSIGHKLIDWPDGGLPDFGKP